MATGGAEEHFAKKLANNDKVVRDRTVRKLRAWISSRPEHGKGFSEADLLKIWKGLFYCMWMSDKPLVQEELTETLSHLIHSFRNVDSAVLFIEVFFKTMHREWHGIDRLRLDKFYLLLRAFVNQSFQLLKRHKWEERLTEKLTDVYSKGPLRPNSEATPAGITLHLAENYFVELQKAGGAEIEPATVLRLLDPLLSLLAQTKNKTMARAVKEGVLEVLIKQGSEDELEEQEEMGPHCQVDLNALAEKLFQLASSREILGRNRNQLYDYSKKFRGLANSNLSNEKRKLENGESADDTEPQDVAGGQAVALEPVKKKRKKKTDRDTAKGSQEERPGPDISRSEENEEKAAEGTRKEKVGPAQRIGQGSNNLEGRATKTRRKGGKKDSGPSEQVNKKAEETETAEQDETRTRTKHGKKVRGGNLGQYQENDEKCSGSGTVVEARNTGLSGLANHVKKEKRRTRSSATQDAQISKQSNKEETGERDQGKSGLLDGKENEKKKGKRSRRRVQDQQANEESNELEKNAQSDDGAKTEDKNSKKERRKTENKTVNCGTNMQVESRDCTVELSVKKTEARDSRRAAQNGEEPFATFLKVKSTPPAFVRKAVAKVQSRTEPRKPKAQDAPGARATPQSAPAGAARKRVRIELEMNTAQTQQDYHRSVVDSPDIPFSADRSPSHGLLRPSVPTPVTTKQRLRKGSKNTTRNRAKAADFF